MEDRVESLKANGMESYFVKTKQEVLELVKKLIPQNATVGAGGSSSLVQCGILELLKNGNYNYLDRHKEGLTADEVYEVLKKSLTAEYYLSSSNAVTQDGQLYNVDGTGNRLAALNFGPDFLIFVVGTNKIGYICGILYII